MYYAQRAAAVICILAMAVAAWYAIRWARADAAFRTQTPAGTARAAELVPGQRTYQTAAALQAEYDGLDSTAQLANIAKAHPRAAAPRLQLGLAAEIRGNHQEAERWLLEAYAIDKMFETRWTLANFYFRQGREDDFWTWIKRALEVSYGDRWPIFDLCWRASEDGAEILERALPDRVDVLSGFLWFTMETQRPEGLAETARKLAAMSASDAALPATIDTLLAARRYDEASSVWQAMGHPSPAGVHNGDFVSPPSDQGFDWRRVRNTGVTFAPLDAGRGFRVRLSGDQPEECELLRQWLGGLRPGVRYKLRWQADLEGARGVEWRIAGVPAEVTTAGELTFTAPAEVTLLTLAYARPKGEVRREARIDLQRVWLE